MSRGENPSGEQETERLPPSHPKPGGQVVKDKEGEGGAVEEGGDHQETPKSCAEVRWPHGSRVKEDILFMKMKVKVNVVCAQKRRSQETIVWSSGRH